MNNNLPLLRFKANRMTQKEFATAVGVGLSTACSWEKDINRMTVGKLLVVCEFFGITPNELLLDQEK